MFKSRLISTLLAASVLSSMPVMATNISLEQLTEDVNFLASDQLKGRGNYSQDIHQAADYIAKRFKQIGLQPLAGNSFLQAYQLYQVKPVATQMTLNNQVIEQQHIITVSHQANLHWQSLDEVELHQLGAEQNFRALIQQINQQGGQHLVLVAPAHEALFKRYQHYLAQGFARLDLNPKHNLMLVLTDQTAITQFDIKAQSNISTVQLANVVGVLPANKPSSEKIVFSAHYDHLGESDNAKANDNIYNGADDDASGTAAVINLAQYYVEQPRARDLVFTAFSAEEIGGFGSKYFSEQLNPDEIVAMINIEMIGKASKFGAGTFWMTGTERSSLFSDLNQALKPSGQQIYQDPYPKQNLFYRSDNATLARLGVPAHSFSSTQLDKDQYYHQVTDDLSSLNLPSMHQVVNSLATATQPLVDGSVTPSRIEKSEVLAKGLIF